MRIWQFLIFGVTGLFMYSHFTFASQESITLMMHDGLKLEARFQSPENPKGIVLILPSSGISDYDGDLSSNLVGYGYKKQSAKLSAQTANFLETNGLASLRYTKRVTFGKDGTTHLASFDDMITDAQTAYEWMQTKYPQLKKTIIGFSEGALVALHLTTRVENLDRVFLLGMPTRSLDELFQFQFIDWPLSIANKADLNGDGTISSYELDFFDGKLTFPYFGKDFAGVPALSLDSNHDGELSIYSEVKSKYEKFHKAAMGTMKMAPYDLWMSSSRALPSFTEVASKYAGNVYLYQGAEDSHVPVHWLAQDVLAFSSSKTVLLHKFPGLGHCFAPMEGVASEIRTSGPFDQALLNVLAEDLKKEF